MVGNETVSQTSAVASDPLEGEDIRTVHWEDARHWIGIYSDLLGFKSGLLERIGRELLNLPEPARVAASRDLDIIRAQMAGYQARLDLWYKRVWELQGLWVDPEGNVIRYQGKEVALTGREAQLLGFLIEHPQRYFSAAQILGHAWGDPALFPEEVRNYIHRLRRILRELQIPCQLVNRPKRGYSLVFRDL